MEAVKPLKAMPKLMSEEEWKRACEVDKIHELLAVLWIVQQHCERADEDRLYSMHIAAIYNRVNEVLEK